ncbi:MAG: PIN domain-containing protein [Propionibacteriaceae bacterium]|nr:PIN domain-containing protein [Propionibacteriaceae bacterium]
MIIVFLDACVLVPITLTNVILTAADYGLLQPCWSPEVIEEAVEAIMEIRLDLSEERIRRRFAAMNEAFEGARTSGNPAMLDGHSFPDPDDQHVVAAAVGAGAAVIVTANIRDFPKPLLAELGLAVMSPDELLLELLKAQTEAMVNVVTKVAAALRNPSKTPEDILEALTLAGAPGFAASVRSLLTT